MTEQEIDAFNDGYEAQVAKNVAQVAKRYQGTELLTSFNRGVEAAYLDHMNDFRDQG